MKRLIVTLIILVGVLACSKEDDSIERMEQCEVPLSEKAGNAVDLGLSVLWAEDNLGGRFAWGETESKTYFSEYGYEYCVDGAYVEIGRTITGSKYDAARINWGGKWRMPTEREFRELFDKCEWYDYGNGTIKATGPNGNYIYFKEEKMISQNSGYWTADQFGNYPDYAWGAAISWNCFTQGLGKPSGLLIRPVMDK